MAKKIKITRKQIKQPDDFLTRSEQIWDWAEEHTWQAAGVVAGIVVLFLAIQGVLAIVRSSGQTPRTELAASVQTFKAPLMAQDRINLPGTPEAFATNKEKYQKAAASFSELAKNYPHNPEGQVALLYLARSKQELGQYDAAIENYHKFLASKVASKESILKYSALMGLGQSSFAAGKYDQALGFYKQVVDADTAFKPAAMMAIARCEFKLSHQDESTKGLEALRKDFPDDWQAQPADFLAAFWQQEKELPPPPVPEKMESSEPSQSSSSEAGNTLPLLPLSGSTETK